VFLLRHATVSVLVAAALVLSTASVGAHESPGIDVRQRVFYTSQSLDKSKAKVGHRVHNRRSNDVYLKCIIFIRAKWFHPVTGETRMYDQKFFLVRYAVEERSRFKVRGTIFVKHGELIGDPQWQPQGVTVETPHCHAR
jgi:hypothetical protein